MYDVSLHFHCQRTEWFLLSEGWCLCMRNYRMWVKTLDTKWISREILIFWWTDTVCIHTITHIKICYANMFSPSYRTMNDVSDNVSQIIFSFRKKVSVSLPECGCVVLFYSCFTFDSFQRRFISFPFHFTPVLFSFYCHFVPFFKNCHFKIK